ncbi:MAG TPA: hypothetical protein DDY37_07155 [Legionella sp.]|nr:hypothetical protein [Legionella sp.]
MRKHPASAPNHPEAFFLLRALLGLFYRQKWIILSMTAGGVLMGSLYLWNSTPLYEAKACIVSPTIGDIAGLHAEHPVARHDAVPPFTVKSIYRLFVQALASQSTQHTFFDASALLLHGMTHVQFDKQFLVREEPDFSPGKHPAKYSVTVKAPTAALARDWVEQYVTLAKKIAMDNLVGIMTAQNKSAAQAVLQQIERIQRIAEQARVDRLTQLNEALKIAHAIGLNGASGDSSSLYMRGSKALAAEINALTMRESNDAFTPGLRALQAEYASLQKNPTHLNDLNMFHLDGTITVSNTPVSPKKQLILMLSLVLGLSLGCLMALIRDLFLMNTPHEARERAPGLMRRIWG